jgi:transposase-like protein
MTPEEALERMEMFGSQSSVPQIYADMGITRLRILIAETNKPPRPTAIDRALAPAVVPVAAPIASPVVAPIAASSDEALPRLPLKRSETLLQKALANPRRVHTPARQRAAFRYHLAACGSVAEAAARAGVNRGSLYRWRTQFPTFAARWDEAIASHAREAGDDIALQASQVEVQPLFYKGKKVGERRKVNTRLLIHVQKRMDGERHRVEDRAERRELALLKAQPFDEVALAERLFARLETHFKTSHPATPAATSGSEDSASSDKGLADAA